MIFFCSSKKEKFLKLFGTRRERERKIVEDLKEIYVTVTVSPTNFQRFFLTLPCCSSDTEAEAHVDISA